MKKPTKALVGIAAAGAMAVSAATPAMARDRDGGIDTGDVIAGALVIGGIAAIAAAASNKRDDRYRDGRYRYGRDYNYDRAGYRNRAGMSQRAAVRTCVRAAESDANRYRYGRANVTDVSRVRQRRDGYDIRGRITVESRRYGHGYDSGKFTCKVRYGRVADIDYSGIRGL